MSPKTVRRRPSRVLPIWLIFSMGLLVWLLAFSGSTARATPSTIQWPEIALTPVITGLTRPVYVTHAGDGSGRIFVVEQTGYIRIFKNGALLSTPFLDVHSRVSCCGEQGLLSVAFPPGYESKGYFYVDYTNTSGNTVVARYHVNPTNPDVAITSTEQIVLAVSQPFANHNGGQLAFGPHDGYLYIGLGDGGSGGDPGNRAQNPDELLGKLLRIDVETGNPVTYTIPVTNPYTQTAGYRGEVWALGLRNPWRFSFDRQTQALYVGDVGQSSWEEIDYQPVSSPGGENYGWRCYEGNHAYNTTGCGPAGNYTSPVFEYSHTLGCSVTGGFVYRGVVYPRMQGVYFYGDACSGRIWGLKFDGSSWQNTQLSQLANASYAITTFGEDEVGNVYIAHYNNGTVYQITDPNACCDFNKNGQVDSGDIEQVAAEWGKTNSPYDFNVSGEVKADDVMFVASRWRNAVPLPQP
jgi:glucose/arabinose dehydrogenase